MRPPARRQPPTCRATTAASRGPPGSEIPFRDIPFSEDQALGADLLAAGWAKVYNPAARVVHSHDHGLIDGFRRYFDEYRGLRDSVGQKSRGLARAARSASSASSVAADRAYLAREEPSALGPRALDGPERACTTPGAWSSAASASVPT